MLHTTVELISLASSNYHVLFCFCNVIIMILLMGNSKSSTRQTKTNLIATTTTKSYSQNHLKPVSSKSSTSTQRQFNVATPMSLATNVSVVQSIALEGVDGTQELKVDKEDSDKDKAKVEFELEEEEDQGEQEELSPLVDSGDDELRRKVEEFINRVNTEWRAERIRTSY